MLLVLQGLNSRRRVSFHVYKLIQAGLDVDAKFKLSSHPTHPTPEYILLYRPHPHSLVFFVN